MLRLLEPPGSCRESLWQRLLEGTYDKPFIVDSGLRRSLHFNLETVQSTMHLEDPDGLSLAYTRKMMAFLLFNPTPARILLLGLGGGSLAKFCSRRLPWAAVTAVEVNPDVIALREAFRIPADSDRFRVIRADAAAYLADLGESADVILADACDRAGIARQLGAIEFYRHAHRCLSADGVLVANMCGSRNDCAAHLLKIRAVFDDELVTLPVRADGNVIVLAFKAPRAAIDWDRLAAVAVDLRRRFGLDFPKHVRRMALEWRLRRWEHGVRQASHAGDALPGRVPLAT